MKWLIIIFIFINNLSSNSQTLADYFTRIDANYWDAEYIDSNTVIIVGSNGASIISSDNCKTWKKNNTKTLELLQDVEYNPNSKTLFAVGNNGILIKSTNLGNDWNKIDLGMTSNLSSISFFKNVGFISGKNGALLRTMDDGFTWEKINLNTSKFLSKIKILESGRVVTADSSSVIYISDDYFDSYKVVNQNGELDKSQIFEIKSKNNFIILKNANGMIISYDSGNNWVFKSTQGFIIQGLEIIDSTNLISIVGQKGGESYKYINLFHIKISDELEITEKEVIQDLQYNMYPTEAVSILLNPLRPLKEAIIFGLKNSISLSTDSLRTWNTVSILNFDKLSSYHFKNRNRAYIGTSKNQIFRTSDGGVTWLPNKHNPKLNTATKIIQLHFDDESNGTAFPNQENMSITNDGGYTFAEFAWESYKEPESIIPFNKDKFCNLDYEVFINSSNNALIYSRINFSDITKNIARSQYLDSFYFDSGIFINENKLLFIGFKYDTLFTVLKPTPKLHKVVHPVILTSDNFGETISINNSDLKITQVVNLQSFFEGKFIFLDGIFSNDDERIFNYYLSTDYGNNWKLLSTSDKNNFGDLLLEESGKGYRFSPNGEIFSTTDFGVSWALFFKDSLNKHSFGKITFVDSTVYLLGDNGLYKSIPSKLFPTTVNETEIIETGPPPFWLYPPYPNSTNNSLSFSILWDKRIENTVLKIELFDITGFKVKDLSNLPKNYELDNKATINFSTDDLINGIYYLTVSYDGYVKTFPIAIVHK